jgi:hypothetical protein
LALSAWPPHLQPLPLFLPPLRIQQLLPPLPLVVLWCFPQPWLRPRYAKYGYSCTVQYNGDLELAI